MDILNDLKLKYPYWIDPNLDAVLLEKGPKYYQLIYKYVDGSEQVESLSFVSFSDSSFCISTEPQEQAKEHFIALDFSTVIHTMDFFGDQAESIFDFCLGGSKRENTPISNNSNVNILKLLNFSGSPLGLPDQMWLAQPTERAGVGGQNDKNQQLLSFRRSLKRSKPFTASGNQYGIYYTVYHDEVGFTSDHFVWFQDAFSLFNFLKFELPYNCFSDKSNEGADLNELWKWTLHELMELKDYTRYIVNACELIESGEELLDFNSEPYLPNEYHRGLRDIEVRWIGSVQNMHATKSEAFKALLDDIPQNSESMEEYCKYTIEQLHDYEMVRDLEHGHRIVEDYFGEIMMDFSNDQERAAFMKDKLKECAWFKAYITAPGHSKLVVEKATESYSYYKAFYSKMLQKLLSEIKKHTNYLNGNSSIRVGIKH